MQADKEAGNAKQQTIEAAGGDRRARWRNISLTMLVLSAFTFGFSYTIADADLWGHIKFGQDILQSQQIVQSDVYSYVSRGEPWYHHEWLAEVLFASAYQLAGTPGLVALKVLVSLLIIGLSYGHLRRRGLIAPRAWSLLVVCSLLLLIGLATIRPQMFTYLFFLLVLLILYEADHGQVQWLWALPPLFVLWVNTHGGVLSGVGLFGLWALLYLSRGLLETRRPASLLVRPNLTVILVLIVSLFATLLNPYGLDLLVFLVRTTTVPRPDISEWRPLSVWSWVGAVYLILVLIAAGGLVLSRRKKSVTLVVLFGVMTLLPLIAIRHVPLFALATLVLVGEHIGDTWEQLLPRRTRSKGTNPRVRFEAGVMVVSLLAAVALFAASIPHWGCIRADPLSYPYQAVGLLSRAGVQGNMAVYFDWGDYTIWHLGPKVQVSVDGRRETVYDDYGYRKNLAFFSGTGDWDALLTEYETELALMRRDSPPYNLLHLRPGWLIAYEDDLSAIAVKEGTPLIEQIKGNEPPPLPRREYLCFPVD